MSSPLNSIGWPEVAELKDITITPLLGPISKGSMTIAASPRASELQHFRYGSEGALNIEALDDPTPPARVIEEPVIYGGLLFRHFGHAISESIHRLWPRYAVRECSSAQVAFNFVKNFKITPYITEAMNLHGISRSQIIAINEPILFRRLFVGRQARTLAAPTTIDGYRKMLDRDHARRLPPATGDRRLYISRLHHHHTGSFYGETFVEKALAEHGFEIVYPEHHTLTELVIILRNASIAIFAEGSAIHALELCGSSVPAVAVISRRPVSRERFSPLLEDISGRWIISDHLLTTAGMALDGKKNSGIVDLPAVMRDLRAFAGLPEDFDLRHGEMLEAVEHDMDRHIEDPRSDRTSDYDTRADALRQVVRQAAGTAGKWAA